MFIAAERTYAHQLRRNAINYNWMRWFINLAVEFAFMQWKALRWADVYEQQRMKEKDGTKIESVLYLYTQVCMWLLCKYEPNQTKPNWIFDNDVNSLFFVFFCIEFSTGKRHSILFDDLSCWKVSVEVHKERAFIQSIQFSVMFLI